ncbi:MAG: hypothetical protein H7A21_03135 [Spirochaetales bacterium]|nr:hypothetical protein [Leptospiraceae bacterium]MCP5480403.1 hypothetical protein [Spirochaetales bacterium]
MKTKTTHSRLRNVSKPLAVPTGLALVLFGTSACRTNELLYEPLTTPEQWCAMRPCVEIGGTVFNEPLGSFLVFLLAALWVLAGVYFLKMHREQKSRVWFGVSLVLGGIGAAQAGISYQAFSYALKCAGQEFCLLTNGFEIGYSLTQAISVSAMLTAVGYACTRGVFRKIVFAYCALNAIVYVAISILGMTEPNRTLLSFEVLMLFALPGVLFVILISGYKYVRTREALSGSLLMAALLFVVVQVAYFWYYAAGITQALYRNGEGFYFSENDVLHVGMIGWLVYIVLVVGKHLRDLGGDARAA